MQTNQVLCRMFRNIGLSLHFILSKYFFFNKNVQKVLDDLFQFQLGKKNALGNIHSFGFKSIRNIANCGVLTGLTGVCNCLLKTFYYMARHEFCRLKCICSSYETKATAESLITWKFIAVALFAEFLVWYM